MTYILFLAKFLYFARALSRAAFFCVAQKDYKSFSGADIVCHSGHDSLLGCRMTYPPPGQVFYFAHVLLMVVSFVVTQKDYTSFSGGDLLCHSGHCSLLGGKMTYPSLS